MKFLNELLGFAVLTGPLWLIVILLPVSLWIAVKRLKQGGTRIAGVAGIFLFANRTMPTLYGMDDNDSFIGGEGSNTLQLGGVKSREHMLGNGNTNPLREAV